MDYFNIRWPKTISQKRNKEVALLAFGEWEILGGVKGGSKHISTHWDRKRRTQGSGAKKKKKKRKKYIYTVTAVRIFYCAVE